MRYYEETRTGLYRSRDGVIFGVCRGLAEYLDVSVTGARILTVIAAFVTGFWPAAIAYVAAALIMKEEPRYYY